MKALSPERQAILRVLEEAGEPLGPSAVTQALGKTGTATKKTMYAMYTAGQLILHSRGKYLPAPGYGGTGEVTTESTGETGGDLFIVTAGLDAEATVTGETENLIDKGKPAPSGMYMFWYGDGSNPRTVPMKYD